MMIIIMITRIFGGDIRVIGRYASHPPAYSEYGRSQVYFLLRPTIYAFNTTIFLTDIKDRASQPLNTYSINFSPENLWRILEERAKRKITEEGKNISDVTEEELRNKIKETSSPIEKFLLNFPLISLGKSIIHYSELTASEITINGLNIEFNPSPIYTCISFGRMYSIYQNNIPTSLKREFLGLRSGFGKQNGNNIILSFIKVEDRDSLIGPDTILNTPKSNYILGLGTNIEWSTLKVESEISLSAFTENKRDTMPIDIDMNIKPPKWVSINRTTYVDYAWKIGIHTEVHKTNLSTTLKMIGPGYKSLASPNLYNDQIYFNVDISRIFFNGLMNVNVLYSQWEDNLLKTKTYKTLVKNIIFNIGITPKNLPSFNIYYNHGFTVSSQRFLIHTYSLLSYYRGLNLGGNYMESKYEYTNRTDYTVYAGYATRIGKFALYTRYAYSNVNKNSYDASITFYPLQYISIMWTGRIQRDKKTNGLDSRVIFRNKLILSILSLRAYVDNYKDRTEKILEASLLMRF